jgi:hypothetical protein
LTGTNTALRTLISDRLQVANAVATYQTKAIERAALANTNSSIATQTSRITLVNTNLTGTNTALRTLISDRLQVANAAATYQTKVIERAALANTNAFIKSQLANTNLRINLINTNLTGTNTALRALDTAKLSVANAVAIYQTKAIERAALANTNSYIAAQATRITLVNTNLTGTNTALRTLISDRLQVANASTLYATKASPTTSGLLAHTGRATISTNLTVTGNTSISNFTTTGFIKENVFTITDGASVDINPTNGTIQLWTLGASRTPTATNFLAGQSITLMIDDGTAYAITWTSLPVTWVGGSAPTLATTGYTIIELWKVSTTIYGALVGNA